MSEIYDEYKAFAARVEEARVELPTVVDEVTKIFEAVRQNHPDISAFPVSEVLVPQPDTDVENVQLVILRWGNRFMRNELGERAVANNLHLRKPSLFGVPQLSGTTTIPDADFQYVVASVADDDIPYVTVAGLKGPTRIDAADFLGDPIGTMRRGLYLSLRNPVRYSRSTVFSGSQATVQHQGFLCTPDGKLVEVGSTGLNFTYAWNVFERENTRQPDQR
jgi:hypothetical protein